MMIWRELYSLIFAVLFILVGKVGDYLDRHPPNYTCPSYCDADHKHFTIDEEKHNDKVPRPMFQEPDSLYTISDIN